MSELVRKAVEAATAKGTDVGTELAKLQDQMRVLRELQESKAQPERKAAEKAAQTSMREGVKTTTYPYVEPKKSVPRTAGGGRGGMMRTGGGGGLPGMEEAMRKGGKVKGYAKGGVTRADGICQRGKTKGTMR